MEAEPTKPDPPQRKRRWFQFSLRTLMIAVTLLAVPCAYVGWQVKIVRDRKATVHEVAEMNGDGGGEAQRDGPHRRSDRLGVGRDSHSHDSPLFATVCKDRS